MDIFFPFFAKGLTTLNFCSVIIYSDGVVAQLEEHHNGIVGVVGSNPINSTIGSFELAEVVKWQTRMIQVHVPLGMGVQVPLSAPNHLEKIPRKMNGDVGNGTLRYNYGYDAVVSFLLNVPLKRPKRFSMERSAGVVL